MLTASGSGLDPEISVRNAMLQASRVARARGVPESDIRALVARTVTDRSLGVFGERRLNVLELNLALERGRR
jgi:K+-transporting ATPase ATPase C chain